MTIERASDNPFPSILMVEGDPEALATDAAAGQRRLAVGTDHLLYLVDDAGVATEVGGGVSGSVATDAIWDAAGDLVQGTGANTAAKLTLGAAGMVVRSTGATNAYAYPPGYEMDYVATTSIATISATSDATANTIVASSSVAYDGSTAVYIEVFLSQIYGPAVANSDIFVVLWEDSTSLGWIGNVRSESANRGVSALLMKVKRTPSNASHTYTAKAYVSSGSGGAGGGSGASAGNFAPAFIRITKV